MKNKSENYIFVSGKDRPVLKSDKTIFLIKINASGKFFDCNKTGDLYSSKKRIKNTVLHKKFKNKSDKKLISLCITQRSSARPLRDVLFWNFDPKKHDCPDDPRLVKHREAKMKKRWEAIAKKLIKAKKAIKAKRLKKKPMKAKRLKKSKKR